MKLVSIIVPCFNASATLKRCVDSLLKQSYENLEIIVINDGSKDDSLKILQSYNDPRLVIIDKKNEGVSATRNAGVRYANGEYISFVDSDDYVDVHYIKKMVDAIEQDDSDYVLCNYYHVKESGIEKNPSLTIQKGCAIQDCFYDIYTKTNYNPPWGKLFKKAYIQNEFDRNMSLGEDLLFNIDYCTHIERVSVINDYLYYYDTLVGGGLSKRVLSIQEFLYLYEYMYDELLQPINYQNKQFAMFILKHFVRFSVDYNYDKKQAYHMFEQFYKKYNIHHWMYNQLMYLSLCKAYQMKKGVKK